MIFWRSSCVGACSETARTRAAFAELPESFFNAAGGDGDAAGREVETPSSLRDFSARSRFSKLSSGSPIPMKTRLRRTGHCGRVSRGSLWLPESAENLPHGHVPGKSHGSRAAERAVHGTAHLSGKALCPADVAFTRCGGNENGFYTFSITKAKQELVVLSELV